MTDTDSVRRNLGAVRARIDKAMKASGRGDEVTVMAVTKTHGADAVRAVIAAGVGVIGENRVSEGGRKIAELGRSAAEFHLVGPLHNREVRRACRYFHSLDAIGRADILDTLSARLARGPVPRILVEVNTTHGEAKQGFPADADLLSRMISKATDSGIRVTGLMTVGPLAGGTGASRRSFALLRSLRDRISGLTGLPLPVLSMGMSDDFEAAVLEGATTIRLGRALLGARVLT